MAPHRIKECTTIQRLYMEKTIYLKSFFYFYSIFLFRFFSLLIVYLVAGMIFMKFVKKAEGKEVIPNSSFWFSIPGNIKVSRFTFNNKFVCKGKIENIRAHVEWC